MPINQTIKKLFILHNILLNVTFQSHSTNHCYKQKRTCLIVTTINPIHCRPFVHVGTYSEFSYISLLTNKHREITFSAHNLPKNQKQMKQLLSSFSIEYFSLH